MNYRLKGGQIKNKVIYNEWWSCSSARIGRTGFLMNNEDKARIQRENNKWCAEWARVNRISRYQTCTQGSRNINKVHYDLVQWWMSKWQRVLGSQWGLDLKNFWAPGTYLIERSCPSPMGGHCLGAVSKARHSPLL